VALKTSVLALMLNSYNRQHVARPSSARRASSLVFLVGATCLFATTGLAADGDYATRRAAVVKKCQAIEPSASQSGLFFNPDGYRSFYVRSQCFQDAAVQFRDATLCADVRQRRALLSSSWGYTAARCRMLVSEGVSSDRRELEGIARRYVTAGITLRDFRVERNGNGRDVDIIPVFAGTYGHAYTLSLEIVRLDAPPVLLHSAGYYVDEESNLRIYIPQTDIRQRFPAFAMNKPYTVRATLTLDVGMGGQSGYWSDAFIESVFPMRDRSRSITRQISFGGVV
jgi:hypothetical protein